MYHAYFGLREEPFGAAPDQRFFLPTEQHREAVATLLYSIQQRRGFSLLYGPPGLGKTSVIVQLMQRLEGKAEVAFLPHPYFDSETVFESVLDALGIPASGSRARDHRNFYEYLLRARGAGKTCVVIFDEAQNLDPETLEAIRMLSNFEAPSEKLLQIVLAGQPRLAETLARPELEQFRQRFSAVIRLRPIEAQFVPDYVKHRLAAAAGSPSLFTADALDLVARVSGGVPRNINAICFNALTIAFALGHASAGVEDATEALADLDLKIPTAVRPSIEASPAQPDFSPSFPAVGRSARATIIAAAVLLVACGTLLFGSALKFF